MKQRPDLPREEWRQFFDAMTRDYEGVDVTVEVVSGELGDLVEAERSPLAYLEYDPKDDQFAVGLEDREGDPVTRHAIDHPQQIMADTVQHGTVRAFDVIDAEGGQTIVTLYLSRLAEGASA
ncbi:DUF5335 family protein [Sphaerisporangium perillae]|uniref:DUF5335 family protein n=1 Tax=Sphaerisporangium perillae TaxID=2935860 RepID=UPI00200F0FA7|nr:DUF5335 family protein [Sphaerisporangium perillae]